MAQTCPTCGSNNPAQRECLEPDCGQSQAHTKHNDCTDPFHSTPAAPETAPLWKCQANRTGDPPQDCDWPFCGCDPYADKVIEAIHESGFTLTKEKGVNG